MRIADAVREATKNQQSVRDFLFKVLDEEANHKGQWRWRDFYDRQIAEFSGSQEARDENT